MATDDLAHTVQLTLARIAYCNEVLQSDLDNANKKTIHKLIADLLIDLADMEEVLIVRKLGFDLPQE